MTHEQAHPDFVRCDSAAISLRRGRRRRHDPAGSSPTDPPSQPVVAELPFPYTAIGSYLFSGVEPPTRADARHMPIYQGHELFLVGADQRGRHLSALPTAGERDGIGIRYGRLNDGVGLSTLRRYLSQAVADPGFRWETPPVVRFGLEGDESDYQRVIRAVRLVNAALPEGYRMTVASDAPSLPPWLGGSATGIYIGFLPSLEGRGWGSTTPIPGPDGALEFAMVSVDRAYTSRGDREATILLADELLHAMGLHAGHVSAAFDSIMEAGPDIYSPQQGIPQPTSLLYPVDREAMRALYSGLLDGASPSTFGPWESMSTHIVGDGEHAAFGVRFVNGYAEPWAYGFWPYQPLADNPALSGTVTWEGSLVGFTPSAAPVIGDAAINVDLATMTGTAGFTDLESWSADAGPGPAGSGAQWRDGDLVYTIAVSGNTFRETGGDAGRLTGIFVGRNHEGAAGTLERNDLTGAFGASR